MYAGVDTDMDVDVDVAADIYMRIKGTDGIYLYLSRFDGIG